MDEPSGITLRCSTAQPGQRTRTAVGTKDQQPAAFSPKTGLFYVPTNHVCMDYEPYQVSYTAGLGAVGAYKSLSSYTQLGGQLTVFKLAN